MLWTEQQETRLRRAGTTVHPPTRPSQPSGSRSLPQRHYSNPAMLNTMSAHVCEEKNAYSHKNWSRTRLDFARSPQIRAACNCASTALRLPLVDRLEDGVGAEVAFFDGGAGVVSRHLGCSGVFKDVEPVINAKARSIIAVLSSCPRQSCNTSFQGLTFRPRLIHMSNKPIHDFPSNHIVFSSARISITTSAHSISCPIASDTA